MSEIGPVNLMNAVDKQEAALSRTASDSITSIAQGDDGATAGEIQQFNLGDVARKAGLEALAKLDEQAGKTLGILDTNA